MMRRLACTVALAMMLSGRAIAGPCVPQDWSKYIDNVVDCVIGIHTLSNFSFMGGSSGLTAAKITARPDGLGLRFDLVDFRVVNTIQGQTFSKALTISFKIEDLSGKFPFTSETLQMQEPLIENGNATIDDPIGLNVGVLQGDLTATKQFATPLAMINVVDTAGVATGQNLGAFSQIERFSVQFTAVPEPSSFVLLISGLVMLSVISRR